MTMFIEVTAVRSDGNMQAELFNVSQIVNICPISLPEPRGNVQTAIELIGYAAPIYAKESYEAIRAAIGYYGVAHI